MNAKATFSIAAAAILTSLLGCSTPHRTETVQPAAAPANSEPLGFAIYRLTSDGRELLADGRLNYTLSDVDVVNWGNKDQLPSWKKSLELANDFKIGVLVVRAIDVPGFGLWIRNDRHPAGFSWEWFQAEAGDIYKKLQGEGRVRVAFSRHADGLEIRSVEFLADITLRFTENVKTVPATKTHVVVVSKGSVFRVAP